MSGVPGLRWAGLIAAVLVLAAMPLRADTIYSNFSTGLQSNWWTTGGGYNEAMLFTPTATGMLTDITVEVATEYGTPSLTVYLETDDGGAPGTVLDTLTTSEALPGVGSEAEITFTCSSCTELDAGTDYFVETVDTASGTLAGWIMSNQAGDVQGNPNAYVGGWEDVSYDGDLGAFQVDATPEPASLALFGTGLLALLGLAWRRRRDAEPEAL